MHAERPSTRTVFVAGRIRAKRAPRPCANGHHSGPFVRLPDPTPDMVAQWENMGIPCPWFDLANCRSCGSTLTLTPGESPKEAA